jgi:hypothetical protein
MDVGTAVVNAPATIPTAAVNAWTGGDCDWNEHLSVVCYGGWLSERSGRTFVTGSTINTQRDKADFAAAYDGKLVEHEVCHTRQWAIFGGGFTNLFPVLYGFEHLRSRGNPRHNIFERWAGLEEGGYR